MSNQNQNQNQMRPQINNRRRLVLFPLPLQGHIKPMLQLANILHSKGFSITIIHTHFNSPVDKLSKHPHLTFLPISDGLSPAETTSMEHLVSIHMLLNSNCVTPFRDCLRGLLADGPIACLITDANWHFPQSVSEEFGIPRMVLRTTSICSFLPYDTFPVLLLQKGYLPKQDSQLETPVPELPPLQVKDLPTPTTNDYMFYYRLIGNIVQQTKASSGLIWNTFSELEESALSRSREQFGIPNFPIGPFHKSFPASSSSSLITEDRSSISWLNTHKPKSVLYVSFGSIAEIDGNDFKEMAWGLANSMQPFLWVVRPGLVRGSEWLKSLPSGFLEKIDGRGCIVKWAPQQEVLAHSAVGFWTHSGWNSTLESVCEGVPMICSPCFGDQLVNAKYASDVWGIGLRFKKGVDREEVERGIRKVMVEREGEEMRERISCLKAKADVCLKEGGSSYQYLEDLISHILSF